MKITGNGASIMTPAVGATAPVAAPAEAAPSTPSAATGSASPLQSSVLQPATEALRSMPEFDAARVAELRDALAKGELPFDAKRLAGMIQRFHGGR
ncbi:flagellar biosynthesis anti-sigma factor FlgM [Massilia sp. Dwa41.01b]|uniref:flagellar biosynthesis anti-sigma factor FlgM n=1 Tax=unclassified Massilia TaxID=2609279 RepID=UPI00160413C9|nr:MULTISPECIES: flagellar biosynthesis anti-sigma factor FlgM [unclassified Massilia]QNA88204.1 flagellar biosynthesis anti-sigma factor FlgM [Massilia sp. Dwa41.01b]QNA99106.1 flagellar biosynthesis anti-sigma factor FlgM [Massilia sp. Se16.2.3]